LKIEVKHRAIRCYSKYGPSFGGSENSDIHVSSNCNANTISHTDRFGDTYVNDTGLNGKTFFVDLDGVKVKEIEVFEITESTALHMNSVRLLRPNCENGKIEKVITAI
jgi:hypothetical protein